MNWYLLVKVLLGSYSLFIFYIFVVVLLLLENNIYKKIEITIILINYIKKL